MTHFIETLVMVWFDFSTQRSASWTGNSASSRSDPNLSPQDWTHDVRDGDESILNQSPFPNRGQLEPPADTIMRTAKTASRT